MGETIEGIAVLIAVVIAVMTGFVTELRAQKSIDSLQEMIYTTAKVIRDGQVMEVESAAIVPGIFSFWQKVMRSLPMHVCWKAAI